MSPSSSGSTAPSTSAAPLSPVRAAAAAAALRHAFGTTETTLFQPLSGGLSGAHVYKIVVAGRPYVLKFDGFACIPAAEAGIAPPVYYHGAGLSVQGFIETQPLRAAFAPGRLVTELAATVRAIHRLPVTAAALPVSGASATVDGAGPVGDPAARGSLRATLDSLVARFRQAPVLSGTVVNACLAGYEAVRAVYPWDDPDQVLSHNDLNPANLLCDGTRIWVIDWDAAFAGDRYVDLAAVANFFVLDDEALFLESYFERPPVAVEKARFSVMRQVSRIVYGLLMVQQGDGFREIGERMLNEAARQTGAPGFDEVLVALQ
jgi:hypothetical protein